jgi:hypothetical protein
MYRVIDNFLCRLQYHIPEINPNQSFHINVGQFIQGYWIYHYLYVKMIRICEKYCIKILQLDLQYVFQMTISTSVDILAHLWNHFSHCFLVYGSFVAHCIGHIDLQTSTPRILSVRPQIRSGVPLKCGSTSHCHSLDASAFVKYNSDELMQATSQFIDMPWCLLRLKEVILKCIVNLLIRSLGKYFF